jgi:DNA-binding response OmpR family regulator
MIDLKDKKQVLIVEDEVRMMQMLGEELMSAGLDVLQATSGEIALRMAKESKPDLVLLDIMLPGIDGMDVLKKMRESDWGKNMPVIILTNLSANETIMGGVMRDEPSYYLIKAESSIESILEKVKEVLG